MRGQYSLDNDHVRCDWTWQVDGRLMSRVLARDWNRGTMAMLLLLLLYYLVYVRVSIYAFACFSSLPFDLS